MLTKKICKKEEFSEKQLQRFYNKISAPNENGCELWTGCTTKKSHRGQVRVNGKIYHVYRLRWELEQGPIPKGMFVCHKCDTPNCVTISHLFLGTPADNSKDAVLKGRQKPSHVVGEAHGKSRWKNEEVLKMRELYSQGYSQNSIAKIFNTKQSIIRLIVKRITWRHI